MNSSSQVRLTSDGGRKFSPVFTRGGDEILYTVLENPTLLRLMQLTVKDRSTRPLHPNFAKSEFEPAASADGRYLAFVHLLGTLSLALQIDDLELKKSASVPPADGFCGMRGPAFTPDGRVLYVFAEGNRQKIYSVTPQATDRKQLTDGSGIDNWPDCSPGGKRIVFSSSRGGNFDIYLMNTDGWELRRLTAGPHRNIRPRFSPDGWRIAFAGFKAGAMRVYVMNADGTGVRCVETGAEQDDFPAWHPDGKRLVLVSERSGRQDLWMIDAPS